MKVTVTPPVERTVTIELTETEAGHLKALLGRIVPGTTEVGRTTDSLYLLLANEGIKGYLSGLNIKMDEYFYMKK